MKRAAGKTAFLLISAALCLAPSLALKGCKPRQSSSRHQPAAAFPSPARPYRILHIMSYHSPWEWTDDQLKGFQDGLGSLPVQYKVLQMDAKRRSSEAWLQAASRQADAFIREWKPDLVYINDDIAQKYVTRRYINTATPFVFGAVNADPDTYGFTGSSNITGVLEREHIVETISLLKEIVPSVTKIAVVVDDDPTWDSVLGRLHQLARTRLKDCQFVSWDRPRTFAEYKAKILSYQKSADAIGLLGVHTFKGADGRNVPWQEVLTWTARNSTLPDFSFWKDRIGFGTLCAVYVSGYEQGLAAGRIARRILYEGKKPSDIPIKPTIKGKPIISLARARRLHLKLKSGLLLTAEIVRDMGETKEVGN